MIRRSSRWPERPTRRGVPSALRIAIVLAGLTLLLFVPTPATAARSEFFGAVEGARLEAPDLNAMAAARIRTDRFLLFWGSVQPSQGSFRWAATDRLIGALASRGIRAAPAVWGNPVWVGGGSSTPPTFSAQARQAWQAFLKTAVARYGPGGAYWGNPYHDRFGAAATALPIQSWEIWNEPNLKGYFAPGPSPGEYARLLKLSHDAVKSRDPRAQIVLAGLASYGDMTAWDFLNRLYSVPGIKQSFDVAALHPYARNVDNVRLATARFRAVITNHDDRATPLWINELGWGSAPPDQFGLNNGPYGQRQMLIDFYNMILSRRNAWNVQRLFWYRWRDDPDDPTPSCSFCASAGLLRSDHSPKPAYFALKSFSAETTPPHATITSGPAEGSTTSDSTPTFSFSSDELGSTFVCRFGAGPYLPCSSPFTRGSPLPDGPHTFSVKAIDAAGNESDPVSRSFTVTT
jgi:hypothetical protein